MWVCELNEFEVYLIIYYRIRWNCFKKNICKIVSQFICQKYIVEDFFFLKSWFKIFQSSE